MNPSLSIPDPRSPIPDPRIVRLRHLVERVQMRLRLREAVSLAPVAVSLGLGATLLMVVAARLRPLLTWLDLLVLGGALVLAALLTVAAYALLRPRDLMATARRADLLLSLDERLSTALEDSQRAWPHPTPEQTALLEAQLDDALATASGVSPGRDLPLALERKRLLPVALALAAVLAAQLAPVPGFGVSEQDRATQAQLSAERKQIEELKKA